MTEKARMRMAIGLCIGLLVICTLMLAVYLLPLLRTSVSSDAPQSDMIGMVLIDIPDQEVAFYHVAQLGVYVLAVQEASQAQKPGGLSDDRLVSINGSQVHTTNDFVQFIQSHTGLPLEMTFTRGPQEEQLFRIFAYNPVSEERVEKR